MTGTTTTTTTPAALPADLAPYAAAWADTMVRIWRDRIRAVGAFRTGGLHASVARAGLRVAGLEASIAFRFVRYGVYVDRGSGPELARARREAGGRLPLLDDAWREARGLDRPRRRGPAWGGGTTSGHARQARPWFDRSWYISRRVMLAHLETLAADAFAGMVATRL